MTCLTITPARRGARPSRGGADLVVAQPSAALRGPQAADRRNHRRPVALRSVRCAVAVYRPTPRSIRRPKASTSGWPPAWGCGASSRWCRTPRPRRGPLGLAGRAAPAGPTRRAIERVPGARAAANGGSARPADPHGGRGPAAPPASFLDAARHNGCDAMVLGETRIPYVSGSRGGRHRAALAGPFRQRAGSPSSAWPTSWPASSPTCKCGPAAGERDPWAWVRA